MEEKKRLTKLLLDMEYVVVGIPVALLLVVASAISGQGMAEWVRVVLCLLALLLVVTAAAFGLLIEQKAGYYECGKCAHRYVPTYGQVLWAPHMGRTRKMRCPRCGQKSWNKKKITCQKCEENKEESI